MTPRACPKFIGCTAPLCPIDADWRRRTMFASERVCFYLAEASKEGAAARFRGGTDEGTYLQAAQTMPAMVEAVGTLRRTLRRTALTPSRVGRRPPAARGEA